MVVKHNKTGHLYILIDDKCKAKINEEWVDAVIYEWRDWKTDKTECFVREKSDFDSHFTIVNGFKMNLDYVKRIFQIYTLKEIAAEYPGKIIENIIAQLEVRRKEIGNSTTEQ